MDCASESVAEAFVCAARAQVDQEWRRIRHSIEQLTDAQIWEQPTPDVNSIGTIVLHLCGNLRQWFLHGLGGQPDVRKRFEEFSGREIVGKAELLSRLESILIEADGILAALRPDELRDARRIQGTDTQVLAAICATTHHLEGHGLQIAYVTHMLVGEKYQPFWKPESVEEGA